MSGRFKRVAIGGSAADPPHLGHLEILKFLLRRNDFDCVVWIVSGVRPDKPQMVDFEHRLNMTYLTIPDNFLYHNPPLLIKPDDLSSGYFTPTITWLKKLRAEGSADELVCYVGADALLKRDCFGGLCEIEALWHKGEELMSEYPFIIFPRAGFPDLATRREFYVWPQRFEIATLRKLVNISSSSIRRRLEAGQSIEGLVTPQVEEYINRFDLYKRR